MKPALEGHIKLHTDLSPKRDRVYFLALALCGEAGELANELKKTWRGDGGDRREKVIAELADVANYAFMLARELGVDLPEAMEKKFVEVEQRPKFKRSLARHENDANKERVFR